MKPTRHLKFIHNALEPLRRDRRHAPCRPNYHSNSAFSQPSSFVIWSRPSCRVETHNLMWKIVRVQCDHISSAFSLSHFFKIFMDKFNNIDALPTCVHHLFLFHTLKPLKFHLFQTRFHHPLT